MCFWIITYENSRFWNGWDAPTTFATTLIAISITTLPITATVTVIFNRLPFKTTSRQRYHYHLPKSFTLPSYYVLLFNIFVHITMIVIYLFCLRKQIPLKKIGYMWLFTFLNIDTLKMHKKKLEKS